MFILCSTNKSLCYFMNMYQSIYTVVTHQRPLSNAEALCMILGQIYNQSGNVYFYEFVE